MMPKFNRIVLVLLMMLAFSAHAVEFNNITILVSSCDKYSPLWEPFTKSLFKNWPWLADENRSIPIFMIANHKIVTHPRITTINIPHEKSWADNMLRALEQVNTQYVMVLLDDYWINQPVNEQRLLEIYNAMQTQHAAMLHVSNNDPRYQKGPNVAGTSDMMVTDKYAHFKVSLQAAIWDKEALKTLLRPGEDPWSFELAGTARSHGYPAIFLSLAANEPIQYINASHQGHINPLAIAYAQNNNMAFDPGPFPVLGK
ncbi:MAG TPA: hypothetical protein VLG38_02330, partial [Gammaproteobacteria bacterium]|nr:hypothetical protein [Gammaproteobacteria bacterium]